MAAVDQARLFTIAYITLYSILLVLIIIFHYDRKKSITKNIKSIWRKRVIYGASLVQIFDQASDIAVLIVWWELAIQEQSGEDMNDDSLNIEHIDMTTLVDLSVLSLLLSRLFMVNMASLAYMYRQADGHDILLALFDLYVIKQVYIAFRNKRYEPTPAMRMAQLFEAIVESFPQILLQSIYVIRTFDKNINSGQDTWLFGFSIFTSALSIANKFIAWDKLNHAFDDTVATADVKLCKNRGCNAKYFIRIIWRYTHIITRLCLYALLWTVCGGGFLFAFGIISAITYFLISKKFYYSIKVNSEGLISSGIGIQNHRDLDNLHKVTPQTRSDAKYNSNSTHSTPNPVTIPTYTPQTQTDVIINSTNNNHAVLNNNTSNDNKKQYISAAPLSPESKSIKPNTNGSTGSIVDSHSSQPPASSATGQTSTSAAGGGDADISGIASKSSSPETTIKTVALDKKQRVRTTTGDSEYLRSVTVGNDYGFGNTMVNYFFYHVIAVIWIDDLNKRTVYPIYHVIHHLIENIICYSIILLFAFVEFECPFSACAEWEIRNINDNTFVFFYIVVGTFTLIISPLFFIFIKNKALIISNPNYGLTLGMENSNSVQKK